MATKFAEGYVQLRADMMKLRADMEKTKGLIVKQVTATEKKVKPIMTGMFSPQAMLGMAGFMGIAALTQKILSFDDAMIQVRVNARLLGAEGEATFRKLEARAKELGETTMFTATQAANAINQLVLGGLSAEQAIEASGKALQLAAATGMDMARASQVIVDNMKKFGMAASETGRIVDYLISAQTQAQASAEEFAMAHEGAGSVLATLGISMRDATAMMIVLARMGERGAEAGTALRIGFSKLLNQTPEVAKLLKRLGVNVADFVDESGQIKDAIGLFEALANSAMQPADALEIFGAKGSRMLAIFKQIRDEAAAGNDLFKQVTQTLDRDLGMGAKAAEARMQTLWGTLKKLLSAIEGLAIQLANLIKGPLGSFVDALSSAISGVTSFDKESHGMVAALLTAWATMRIGIAVAHKLAGAFLVASTELDMAAVTAKRLAAIRFMGMLGIGVAIMAIRDLTDNQRELIDTSDNLVEKQRRTASVVTEQAEKLKQLADKTKLSNDEMDLAEQIIANITREYGDLGVTVDRTKGTILGAADAMAKLNRRIAEIDVRRMKERQKAIAANIRRLKQDIQEREELLGKAGASTKYQFRPGTGAGRWLMERVFLGGKSVDEMKADIDELYQQWLDLGADIEKTELGATGEVLDEKLEAVRETAKAENSLIDMRKDAERALRDFRIDLIEDQFERERQQVRARYADEMEAIRDVAQASHKMGFLNWRRWLEISKMTEASVAMQREGLADVDKRERKSAFEAAMPGVMGGIAMGAAVGMGAGRKPPPQLVPGRAGHAGLVQFHKMLQTSLMDAESDVEKKQLAEEKKQNKALDHIGATLDKIEKKDGGVFAWQ